MTDPTDYRAELELVNTAIAKVLEGGQDVTYDGKRVVKSDLDSLRKHRDTLVKNIERADRGGVRVRRGVPIS